MIKNYTRGGGLLEAFLAKKRAQKARNLLNNYKNDKILDLGCGSFPFFLTFIDYKDKYGIDPSLTTTKIQGINLKKIDITKSKLPFADNFFDAVTMLAVFEHIEYEKLDFVLKEIKRVLKVGSTLVITTPSPWSDKLLHQMAVVGLISSEEIHEHKHHYSKKDIEKKIENVGFKKNHIESGYFELGMNMWFSAKK